VKGFWRDCPPLRPACDNRSPFGSLGIFLIAADAEFVLQKLDLQVAICSAEQAGLAGVSATRDLHALIKTQIS
jgi:hypothetical protein